MKLIIDIPDTQYNNIMEVKSMNLGRIPYKGIIMNAIRGIQNGTPIPDNATNGDVIKMMFPNDDTVKVMKIRIKSDWWDAPYQKGGINRKNCEYRHENGNCLKVGGFCMSVDDEHCEKGGKG